MRSLAILLNEELGRNPTFYVGTLERVLSYLISSTCKMSTESRTNSGVSGVSQCFIICFKWLFSDHKNQVKA